MSSRLSTDDWRRWLLENIIMKTYLESLNLWFQVRSHCCIRHTQYVLKYTQRKITSKHYTDSSNKRTIFCFVSIFSLFFVFAFVKPASQSISGIGNNITYNVLDLVLSSAPHRPVGKSIDLMIVSQTRLRTYASWLFRLYNKSVVDRSLSSSAKSILSGFRENFRKMPKTKSVDSSTIHCTIVVHTSSCHRVINISFVIASYVLLQLCLPIKYSQPATHMCIWLKSCVIRKCHEPESEKEREERERSRECIRVNGKKRKYIAKYVKNNE